MPHIDDWPELLTSYSTVVMVKYNFTDIYNSLTDQRYFLGAHEGSGFCLCMASDTPDNFGLTVVLSRTVDSEPLVMPCKEQRLLKTVNASLEHTKAVDSVFAWPAILLITSV